MKSDLTKIVQNDIERQIHPLLIQQFAARAEQKNMLEKELAEKMGVTDVQFSRMKRGDKDDWRPLPAERAQKAMEALNYRSSQIKQVVTTLEGMRENRSKRRTLMKYKGLDKLKVECILPKKDEQQVVFLDIRNPRRSKVAAQVAIDCKGKNILYAVVRNGKQTVVPFSEAAKALLPHKFGEVVLMLRIVVALDHEWFKALFGDLDNLDTEEDTLRRLARLSNIRGGNPVDTLNKAKTAYREHTGL